MSRFFTYKTKDGLLFLSIMMLMSLVTQAQNAQSGSGSNNTQPEKTKTLSSLRSTTTGTFTLNGTAYTSWSEAMKSLQEDNNEIVLTSDLLYLLNEEWPDKPCTISSDETKRTLKNACTEIGKEGEFYATISMRAPLTFKNIKLGAWNIIANGHKLVMDEGIECISGYDNVQNAIRAIYGAANDTDVASSEIIIKSGTYGWIYGGSGNTGNVSGTAKVTMTNGTVYESLSGGGYDGTCGNTEVTITGGTAEVVFGAGFAGSVKGNVIINLEDAVIVNNIYASSGKSTNEVAVGGNSTITLKNTTVGLFIGDGQGLNEDTDPYTKGTIDITIENSTVSMIMLNLPESKKGLSGQRILRFKNYGTKQSPYIFSSSAHFAGFTEIVLDNSFIKTTNEIKFDTKIKDEPLIIRGDGLTGERYIISLTYFPTENAILVEATDLTTEAKFYGHNKQLYRLAGTYRYPGDNVAIRTITITQPDASLGILSIKWGEEELKSGDQVPDGTELTITATPTSGKTLIIKNGNETITSGTPFTINADLNLTVEEKALEPLNLADQSTDITISKEDGIWKYLAGPISRTTPPPVAFNGTITGTLPDEYSILIDASSNGILTFDNVRINAIKSGAALIIAQGADITITRNVLAETNSDNSPAILNYGSITAESGASITGINYSDASKGISISAGGTLLLSAASSLTASGLENEGTVVVKSGATVTDMSGSDLLKTYEVTITTPGNGNTLTAKAGNISITTGDELAENTPITLAATAAANYTLQKITVTPESEAGVTVANNGIYKMTAKAITITASFNYTPPYVPPVYYTVTLPAVEGATTDPVAGEHKVEDWDNFRFYLTLDADYNRSEPVVTTDRGETISPRSSDGAYIVKYVCTDIVITISDIVKNPDPVANADIKSGTVISTHDGILFITTDRPTRASVIAFNGQTVRRLSLPAGETRIYSLAEGLYIVRLDDGTTQKVIVRK